MYIHYIYTYVLKKQFKYKQYLIHMFKLHVIKLDTPVFVSLVYKKMMTLV